MKLPLFKRSAKLGLCLLFGVLILGAPIAFDCLVGAREPARSPGAEVAINTSSGSAVIPVRPSAGGSLNRRNSLIISRPGNEAVRSVTPRSRRRRDAQESIVALVNDLRNKLILPDPLGLSFEDCEYPDSFYESKSRKITICNELIDDYHRLFLRSSSRRGQLDPTATAAVDAVFLHELGHALIDAWELPITGREEDAADQFAVLTMINGLKDGERMALNSARSYRLYAAQDWESDYYFWDAHSTDEQRYYDTLCLLYGHDTKKFGYLVDNGSLPTERAEQCAEDYSRISRSWRTLLASHYVGAGT